MAQSNQSNQSNHSVISNASNMVNAANATTIVNLSNSSFEVLVIQQFDVEVSVHPFAFNGSIGCFRLLILKDS
jgi:hypothetical protein